MDRTILYYWQELNKKFSPNQTFCILSYWILVGCQQKTESCMASKRFSELREYLLCTVKQSLNYDVKEAAVRLSDRIEWPLLEKDEPVQQLLTSFEIDVKHLIYGRRNISDKTDNRLENGISGRLIQLMGVLFQIAAINELYSITPDSINGVVRCLTAQMEADKIIDLCCGSGLLGITVWQNLKEPTKAGYCGVDLEPIMCDICTFMTYICGIPHSTIILQDVLHSGIAGNEEKYDLVLLDVPKGQNKSIQLQEKMEWLGDLSKKNIYVDWLYIERALECLSDKGRGIVIVTSGTLTRKNEADLRKKALESDCVEAVITMPVNLYPNTRIGSEIIVFNKSKSKERVNKILFLDISKYYFRDNRNFYSVREEGINLVADIFHRYYEMQGVSRIIDISQVDRLTWSWKPFRYIGAIPKEESGQPMCCIKDIAQVIRGVQLKKEEEDFLCQSGTAFYLNIKDIRDGCICYTDAKMITPKRSDWHQKFQIREDDILITSKGTSLKIAIVEENPPEAYICGNLTIIRINDKRKYHPYIIYEFLKSSEGQRSLESIQSGSTIRVLNNENLGRFQVPIYEQKLMQKVGDRLKEKRSRYEAERKQLTEKYVMERKSLLELVGIEL